MKKKKLTIIFPLIWAAFFIIFSIMGYLSYQSVDTKLPRYVYEAPETVRVAVLKENILEVMENISRTHNTVVENLEKSIQGEAKTMLAINIVSAFLCLLGLLAQIKT